MPNEYQEWIKTQIKQERALILNKLKNKSIDEQNKWFSSKEAIKYFKDIENLEKELN